MHHSIVEKGKKKFKTVFYDVEMNVIHAKINPGHSLTQNVTQITTCTLLDVTNNRENKQIGRKTRHQIQALTLTIILDPEF